MDKAIELTRQLIEIPSVSGDEANILAFLQGKGIVLKEPSVVATDKETGKVMAVGRAAKIMLGKTPDNIVKSEYNDFRTKEAKAWKAEMEAQGKVILKQAEWEVVEKVVERLGEHPLASQLLKSEGVVVQQEIRAEINGEDWVGYIDAIKKTGDKYDYLVDLKTTAQFDDFKWSVKRNDYDLQAVVYDRIVGQPDMPFYWVVAETVPPYRVKVAEASEWTKESGMEKFYIVADEIAKFKARKGVDDLDRINFNQNNTIEEVEII